MCIRDRARELLAAAGDDEARERAAQVPGVGCCCLGLEAAAAVLAPEDAARAKAVLAPRAEAGETTP
eukprot:9082011-Alexandrium_andersonii.AAC.1